MARKKNLNVRKFYRDNKKTITAVVNKKHSSFSESIVETFLEGKCVDNKMKKNLFYKVILTHILDQVMGNKIIR